MARTSGGSKPERVEEKRYHAWVQAVGGLSIKLSTAGPFGTTGFNDRLSLLPHETVLFFEFKREGEEAEKIQNYRHRQIKRLGFKTYVVYKAEEAIETSKREVTRRAKEAVLLSKALPKGKH